MEGIESIIRYFSNKYDLRVKVSGREFSLLCPFHLDTKNSLFVNSENGLWHCFGCGLGGNFSRLVSFLNKKFGENVSLNSQKFFYVGDDSKVSNKWRNKMSNNGVFGSLLSYFLSRDFSADAYYKVINYFGLGCSKDKIVFPVWDFDVFYVGKFYRLINEKGYFFEKNFLASKFFYGEWLLSRDSDMVVLVEGAFDLFRVYLAGFNCLATLNFSKASLKLARLSKLGSVKRIVLFFDSDIWDKPVIDKWRYYGDKFFGDVKEVHLESGDPADYSIEDIKGFLSDVR